MYLCIAYRDWWKWVSDELNLWQNERVTWSGLFLHFDVSDLFALDYIFYCGVFSTLFYLTTTLLSAFCQLASLVNICVLSLFLSLGFFLCLLTPLIWLFSLPVLLLHARVVCLFWCVRSDDSRPLPHTPLPRDRGVRGGGHQQRGLLSPCLPLPFSRG